MRKLLKAGAIACSLALGGGALYAQQDGGDTEDDKSVEATIKGEKKDSLTPAQMAQEADELIKAMREGLKSVIAVQQIARKQKDVIKLNCVNDKLLQVKQLLNIAETANTDLQEAIAQSDENERYHQYGKIVVAAEQVRLLVEESRNCIGEELVYVGPLQVDVDKPEVEDPGDDTDPSVEPPAYASPFR